NSDSESPERSESPDIKEQEEQNEPINQLIPYEEPPDDPLESVNPVIPSDNQPPLLPIPSLPPFASKELLSSISLNELPDSIVIVSSYHDNFVPEEGKINNNSYWKPANNDAEPWIQFNYSRNYEVLAIHIKCDDSSNFNLLQVKVSFANDDSLNWHK